YNPPSRTTLSTTLLNQEAGEVMISTEDQLRYLKNLSLYYSSEKHTAEFLSNEIKCILERAGSMLRQEINDHLIIGGNLQGYVKTRWVTAYD
ncbi:4686_t:CDS:2, partial [Entrophospora sp. SA101]